MKNRFLRNRCYHSSATYKDLTCFNISSSKPTTAALSGFPLNKISDKGSGLAVQHFGVCLRAG
jgi:hypothetical protein